MHNLTIGERLRWLRTERHLTMRELAVPGVVGASMIARIEADERKPSIEALRAIASKLGVSPYMLEFGVENPETVAGDKLAEHAAAVVAAWAEQNGDFDGPGDELVEAVGELGTSLDQYDIVRGRT